jgi:hypothetical protein
MLFLYNPAAVALVTFSYSGARGQDSTHPISALLLSQLTPWYFFVTSFGHSICLCLQISFVGFSVHSQPVEYKLLPCPLLFLTAWS